MKKSMAEKILALLEKGWKAKEIAEKLNVSLAYVYATKSKAGKVNKSKDEIVVKLPVSKNLTLEQAIEKLNVPDMVNHPPHYTVGGIETLDFIEAKGLGYNLGNAVKYISRADYKGNKLEDLEKAVFYLKREIRKLVPALTK